MTPTFPSTTIGPRLAAISSGGALVLAGGAFDTIVGVGNSVRSTASYIDGDTILHGNWRLQNNPYFGNQIGLVYADGNLFITDAVMSMSTGLYGGATIYGSSVLDVFGKGGIAYIAGASGAVFVIRRNYALRRFAQTAVCLGIATNSALGAC